MYTWHVEIEATFFLQFVVQEGFYGIRGFRLLLQSLNFLSRMQLFSKFKGNIIPWWDVSGLERR